MSVTNLSDIERDPARYVRRKLEEMWGRVESQAAATAKASREESLREAYAVRHKPESNDAA